ncbi:hypothetical protein QJS10_CPB04g01995 [Acorus calamus]|uniref:Uncharacterized protein n=1 Tax=Acorus calamus TaxID=4465 RepID=A0AAV9F202_ACOCL|nr:hypothetical protein QJS10_CPB04g01995 [Acorus calamus]
MVGVVGGVAVEESFIFGEDGDGNTSLPQSSASLLRLLHYSNIPMAILCGDSVPSEKADFITKITTQYSCCTVINSSVTNDTFDKLLLAWGDAGGICFYLAAKEDEELFNKISNQGWRIIVKSTSRIIQNVV